MTDMPKEGEFRKLVAALSSNSAEDIVVAPVTEKTLQARENGKLRYSWETARNEIKD